MAKPALPWLKKLCALYEKHDSSIYACTADAHVSGVLISLELDRGFMYLLVHPKGLTNSYAETESMSISIHQPEGSGQIPGNGELVARQFINVLSRADKGDIRITGNCTKGSKPEKNIKRVSMDDANAAKNARHKDIQWAAFLAYKSLETTTPITVDTSDPTEAQHQYLMDKLASGFNRSEFKDRFGVDAADVVKGPFEKLMAMGFVSIDGNQVRTHFNDPTEEHVFRSFLQSPAYSLKAKSKWGSEFDPSVDYQVKIRRLLASQ
jgi:hypothetical protein